MSFKEIKPESEEAWLELRTKVLTASDMGVILGLNSWKSVKELLESKKDYVPFENAYTWLGQQLEPVVVDATNKVLGTDFKLFEDSVGKRSFFVDLDLGLGATPDAGSDDILLECKSTKPGNHLKWSFWPPAYYLSQLYTQMMCVGVNEGLLSILGTDLTQQSEELNLPLHIHKIIRTPELDSIFLFETARFWKACHEGKVYRVDRKQAQIIEMMFRLQIERIY